MHKSFFYAKASTSYNPFLNTKESLATLCGPIVADGKFVESWKQSAEASAMVYYALVSFSRMQEARDAASRAIYMFERLPAAGWKDIGTSLAITNVASILNFGARDNQVNLAFTGHVQDQAKHDTSSVKHGPVLSAPSSSCFFDTVPTTIAVPANETTIQFTNKSFGLVLKHHRNRESLSGVLPFVHTNLVWLHSLASLRFRCANDSKTHHMPNSLTAAAPWVKLSRFSMPLPASYLSPTD